MSGLRAQQLYTSIPAALLAVGIDVLLSQSARAAEFALPTGIADLVPAQFRQIETAVSALWDLALIAAALTFLFFLLIGGFQYLNSLGNEEGVKKSRQILMNAAVGLIIIVLAWPVGNAILNYFDLRVGNTNFRIPTLSPSDPTTNLAPTSTNAGNTVLTSLQLGRAAAGQTIIPTSQDGSPLYTPIPIQLDANGSAQVQLPQGDVLLTTLSGDALGGCSITAASITCDGSGGAHHTVTLSVIDNSTFQPVAGFVMTLVKRSLFGDEQIVQTISGTDGKTPPLSVPEGVKIQVRDASTGAELYADTGPSDNGRVWVIQVAQ